MDINKEYPKSSSSLTDTYPQPISIDERRDAILYMIRITGPIAYARRINAMVYLLQEDLKENEKIDLGYKFEYGISGVYSNSLMSDLNFMEMIGYGYCERNFEHSYGLTSSGASFVDWSIKKEIKPEIIKEINRMAEKYKKEYKKEECFRELVGKVIGLYWGEKLGLKRVKDKG